MRPEIITHNRNLSSDLDWESRLEIWAWRLVALASGGDVFFNVICHWLITFTSGVSTANPPSIETISVLMLGVSMRILCLLPNDKVLLREPKKGKTNEN